MRKNVAKMPQFFLVDNPSDWTYNNNMKERTMTIDTKTEAGAYYHAIAKAISTDKFKGAHAIHTPQALVEEVLSKIALQGDILVMFNVEFVISLVYTYNIAPENITFYSDHDNKSRICSKLGVKYITNLETDMKFDVVLANPPYDGELEGKDQTKKIWIAFAHKCLDLLEDNGYLGFVSPPSWVLSNDAKLKKVRNRILDCDLQSLRLGIQNQFPSKPGVQIGYFILKNTPYTGNTQFTDEGTTVSKIIDLRNGLPLTATEQYRQDLIVKIHNASSNKYKFILNDKKGKDLSAGGVLKVIVNYSKAYYSSANTVDNNMPITTDPINNKQGYISVKTQKEGKQHKSFLHSKAIVWFANNYKRRGQTGFCDAVKRCAIPQFQTKNWTDGEVYQVLGLTNDEIAYIESNS